MNAAIRRLEIHFPSDILGGDPAVFGIGREVCLARDINVVTHRPGSMAARRRTFGTDLSAVGEYANLASDPVCCRIVIGTRLHSRNNLHVPPIGAVERHAAVCSAVYRDFRRGRNGIGAHFTEAGTITVPTTLTVVAPALGAIV